MLACSVQSTDVDQFAGVVRPSSVELTITGRECFAASVTLSCGMQRGQETLPRIWQAPPRANARSSRFGPGQVSIRNGKDVGAGSLPCTAVAGRTGTVAARYDGRSRGRRGRP
jgi:hypothetical protein